VDPAARAFMRALVRSGKVRAVGFSTHDRALATREIAAAPADAPWDVVMVRHSAAHPGAERDVLPAARARGTAVLAFSALCYGRMLAARPGADARPGAADCYRYSLSQPGVTAVISAPRRRRELAENLAVLAQPALAPQALEALRAHGRWVRGQSRDFNELVRREPAAAEAPAPRPDRAGDPAHWLDGEPPPLLL
jgi:aryl-alcohol dehydrogenase-like predicted oxidoreductase